jgi:hypothetical protein
VRPYSTAPRRLTRVHEPLLVFGHLFRDRRHAKASRRRIGDSQFPVGEAIRSLNNDAVTSGDQDVTSQEIRGGFRLEKRVDTGSERSVGKESIGPIQSRVVTARDEVLMIAKGARAAALLLLLPIGTSHLAGGGETLSAMGSRDSDTWSGSTSTIGRCGKSCDTRLTALSATPIRSECEPYWGATPLSFDADESADVLDKIARLPFDGEVAESAIRHKPPSGRVRTMKHEEGSA